jgi:threonine dehydrogenase-like Zn-dependent dehydrogenase
MTSKYETYFQAQEPLPADTLTWNLYGAGLENMGRDAQPERFPIPEPGDGQMLVRIDSVSLCFSDVKIIQQGSKHPKLYNRDLTKEPTRLGHETSLTVIKVGKDLADRYHPGQRLAMQPDIYQNGKSTAYGYTLPGGLVQYHLIGEEVLVTDEGACLLPVGREMGYAAASLLEPWGCVMAAYTQRRRLEPKKDGMMWIIGHVDDPEVYQFSAGLDQPKTIVLTDVPASIRELVGKTKALVIERNQVDAESYASLAAELTQGKGFDDIVVLDPTSAAAVAAIAKQIARRGIMNLVGKRALDGKVNSDVGRLHYDYIAFLGNSSADIAASYGEKRNRCDLTRNGVALFLGAGGPMGQMHVQRALEAAEGPRKIIATEVNDVRLQTLGDRLQTLADKNQRELHLINPSKSKESLYDFVMRVSDGKGADDIVLCVPVASLASEAAGLMTPDGMLVLFAGMPNGTLAPLDLSSVYLHNAQFTGTSGLTINDQKVVMQKAAAGSLSPEMAVAAVGGLNTAYEGYQALMQGRYPGKIIIFPQLPDLPLMGLDELKTRLPGVGGKLGPGDIWTMEAEACLIETCWQMRK